MGRGGADLISPQRSWRERTFSRIGAGSVRSTICSLCCSAIGMGVLLLPYTVAQVGPLCTAALLVIGCLASYASLRLCCAGMHAARTNSYVDTLTVLFSERFAAILTLMLVVACVGHCCGYLVFASQLVTQLAQVAGAPAVLCRRDVIVVLASAFMVFPLSLSKNLSDLRYFTLFSITGLTCLVFVVIFRTPRYFGGVVLEPGWWWRMPDPWSLPKCLSLCCTAYVVHMNVFSCYAELENPTAARMNKVLKRAAYLESVLYASVSICGFLSFGADTPDNILRAYDLDDRLANLGRFFISFQLLLAVPLTVHPARLQLWPLLQMAFGIGAKRPRSARAADGAAQGPEAGGSIVPVFRLLKNKLRLVSAPPSPAAQGQEDSEVPGQQAQGEKEGPPAEALLAGSGPEAMPQHVHVLLTVAIVVFSAFVAVKVESASDLLGIVGGFAAVTYAYLLPTEIAQKLRRAPPAGMDWSSSPAAFVAGPCGPAVVAALRICSILGYIGAAQCAWAVIVQAS